MDTQELKAFNATAAGQLAMCDKAQEVGLILMLNRKVASLGGTAWSESQLSQLLSHASHNLVTSVKEDLLNDYNALCALSVPVQK